MVTIDGLEFLLMNKDVGRDPKEGERQKLIKQLRKKIKNKTYEMQTGEIASRLAGELFSTAAFRKDGR
jgi:anti-sigma28 factor (negative regulator of flagellin synthesis)